MTIRRAKSPDQIKQVLLVMDIARDETEVRELGTGHPAALALHEAVESEHRRDPITTPSSQGLTFIEPIRRTHTSYFDMHTDQAELRRLPAALPANETHYGCGSR